MSPGLPEKKQASGLKRQAHIGNNSSRLQKAVPPTIIDQDTLMRLIGHRHSQLEELIENSKSIVSSRKFRLEICEIPDSLSEYVEKSRKYGNEVFFPSKASQLPALVSLYYQESALALSESKPIEAFSFLNSIISIWHTRSPLDREDEQIIDSLISEEKFTEIVGAAKIIAGSAAAAYALSYLYEWGDGPEMGERTRQFYNLAGRKLGIDTLCSFLNLFGESNDMIPLYLINLWSGKGHQEFTASETMRNIACTLPVKAFYALDSGNSIVSRDDSIKYKELETGALGMLLESIGIYDLFSLLPGMRPVCLKSYSPIRNLLASSDLEKLFEAGIAREVFRSASSFYGISTGRYAANEAERAGLIKDTSEDEHSFPHDYRLTEKGKQLVSLICRNIPLMNVNYNSNRIPFFKLSAAKPYEGRYFSSPVEIRE